MIERKRIVSHPGIYIKDAIEELGLNQSEFALRTGLTSKNVSTLISGESNITFDVALKLSSFFDNSVEGWLNLQTKYDLYRYEENLQKEYDSDWQVAKKIDKDFARNYLKIEIDSKHKKESVDQIRRLLGVGVLQSLKHPDMYAFCKTSVLKDINEDTIMMRNAWILLAEQQARKINSKEFDKDKLLESVKALKTLTRRKPNEFVPILRNTLSECGVKLVILPYLSKSNVSGVTKWINNENSVMVAVNDSGKDADKFWFSIFHELGHAIKNHKRHLTISYEKNQIEDQDEIEANEFAKNSLVDKEAYFEFVKQNKFDLKSIEEFAKKQDVADFVVIGRLQKENYIPWNRYQSKKIKYQVI